MQGGGYQTHFTDEETEATHFANDRAWIRTEVASSGDRCTSSPPGSLPSFRPTCSHTTCSSDHCSGLSARAVHLFLEDGSTQIPSDWDTQLYLPSEAQSLLFPGGILRSQMLVTSL